MHAGCGLGCLAVAGGGPPPWHGGADAPDGAHAPDGAAQCHHGVGGGLDGAAALPRDAGAHIATAAESDHAVSGRPASLGGLVRRLYCSRIHVKYVGGAVCSGAKVGAMLNMPTPKRLSFLSAASIEIRINSNCCRLIGLLRQCRTSELVT